MLNRIQKKNEFFWFELIYQKSNKTTVTVK